MKKLAYLKRKKGFTLIELVVVIAIIAVLGGILIPVMIGTVRSANVASANTSAADIRKSINMWISKMDSKGITINKSRNSNNEPYVTVIAEGKQYEVKFSDGFWLYEDDDTEMSKSLSDHLLTNLGYHELVAVGYIDNGAVAALAYCVNKAESTNLLPGFDDFSRTDYWSSTNGIADDGTVIGTSPQILNG